MPHGDFIEIYVDCPIEVCESRDVKGLYQKARDGEINQFTGISSPYEPPEAQELTVNTSQEALKESATKVLNLLKERGIVQADDDWVLKTDNLSFFYRKNISVFHA